MAKIFLSVALADVAQWIECQSAKQRVTDSIPSQVTGPQLGACEWQLHIDVSLLLFLPPFSYLYK